MSEKMAMEDFHQRELKDFFEHPIWVAFIGDMKERKAIALRMLVKAPMEDIWGVNEKGVPVMERAGVRRLQGAIEEMDYIIETKEGIMSAFETEEKEDRK